MRGSFLDYEIHPLSRTSRGSGAAQGASHEDKQTHPLSKIRLDMHSQFHVAVRPQDRATPGAARRFAPAEFVPWVRTLLAAGQAVHVVYESCGLWL